MLPASQYSAASLVSSVSLNGERVARSMSMGRPGGAGRADQCRRVCSQPGWAGRPPPRVELRPACCHPLAPWSCCFGMLISFRVPHGEKFSCGGGRAVCRPSSQTFSGWGGGVSPYGATRARMAVRRRAPAPKRPGADVASRRKIRAKIRRFFRIF